MASSAGSEPASSASVNERNCRLFSDRNLIPFIGIPAAIHRPLLRQIEHVLQKRDLPVDRCRTGAFTRVDLVSLDWKRPDVRQLH